MYIRIHYVDIRTYEKACTANAYIRNILKALAYLVGILVALDSLGHLRPNLPLDLGRVLQMMTGRIVHHGVCVCARCSYGYA